MCACHGHMIVLRSCQFCPLGFSVLYRSALSSASNQSRTYFLLKEVHVVALTEEKEAVRKTARRKTEPFAYLCKPDLNKASLHGLISRITLLCYTMIPRLTD